MNAPADPLDRHRATVRSEFARVTPWRLGAEVGRRGQDLPSPYAPGSRADSAYRAGLRFGRIPTTMRAGSVVLPRSVELAR